MRWELPLILIAAIVPFLLAGGGKPPPARDGGDLVGTHLPDLTFERWIGTPDGKPPDLANKPVLYRWWTGGCRFCETSLPAIESLREKYEPKGLRVVAVYHPKPVRDVPDDAIRRAAKELGYDGVVAVDADWSELKRLWLDAGNRPATSVTIQADGDGVIRFVHPGPAIFPSEDAQHAGENRAYLELDRVIGKLIDARPEK